MKKDYLKSEKFVSDKIVIDIFVFSWDTAKRTKDW